MLLWHYTSIRAFENILKEKKLRASNIRYLNDWSEFAFGLHEMYNLYQKYNKKGKYNEHLKIIHDFWIEGKDPEIYSMSFSEDNNSLYQWVSYTPKQGGLSIGFDIQNQVQDGKKGGNNTVEDMVLHYGFKRISEGKFEHNIMYPNILKCIYLEPGEKQLRIKDLASNRGKSNYASIIRNASHIKNCAFHFEKEHRLFFHRVEGNPFNIPISFDTQKPYLEFGFNTSTIKKIYVSHRGDQRYNAELLLKILNEYGLRDQVEVYQSKIPFRE